MFCSDIQDLILSNVCSIINPTEKCSNTVGLWYRGVAKTNCMDWKCSRAYSWFIHRLSSKFYFVDIFKIPNKIKQNPKSSSSNHLSYPISLNHTKIKHFSHFITQKSNFHLTKNLPTISKSSLFIGTFTDNDFSSKNSKSYNPNIWGYHKTTHKIIKRVIALSYFHAKNKSNREYITKNS